MSVILGNETSQATPSSGNTRVFVESTTSPTKRLRTLDDAGTTVPYVGIATTDTAANRLQNKDLDVSNCNLVDPTDTTKKVAFTASGNTTSVTLTIAARNATSQTLNMPITRETETLAVVAQINSGTSASPTGNVSTTEKAMGLGLVSGFTITPQVTGNVCVWIAGVALNSTAAGDGTNITGRWGTGTAPSNGATSGLGTQFGAIQHFIGSTTAGQQGWMVMGRVTGLALNTAVWFDVSLVAVTGGGSTVKDCQIIVFESA
jgi:hypothetical protein